MTAILGMHLRLDIPHALDLFLQLSDMVRHNGSITRRLMILLFSHIAATVAL